MGLRKNFRHFESVWLLQLLAATGERFWIVQGHSRVRHYLKNCRTCLLWKARACGQVMASQMSRYPGVFEPFRVLGSITLDRS